MSVLLHHATLENLSTMQYYLKIQSLGSLVLKCQAPCCIIINFYLKTVSTMLSFLKALGILICENFVLII